MRRRSPRPAGNVTDAQVVDVARRYRLEATATLIAVCRDERASATARAAAASQLLAYSDGRPGQSRQISVTDLDQMSDDQRGELAQALLSKLDDYHRLELFRALINNFEVQWPGWVRKMHQKAIDGMIAEENRRAGRTPRYGFKRGDAAHQPSGTISASRSAETAEAAPAARPSASAYAAHAQPCSDEVPEQAALPPPAASALPGNVIPLNPLLTDADLERYDRRAMLPRWYR